MPFGLNNAPTIFSRVVVATFREFIHKFFEIYFDYWTVFGLLNKYIEQLRMMFDRCRQCQISLNLKKCIFCSPFGILLGHLVYKHGLIMDPTKIYIIVNLDPPTSVRKLRATLGHYFKKYTHDLGVKSSINVRK